MNRTVKADSWTIHFTPTSEMTVHFKITLAERAAYEDLLVYWEYGDCYYAIEELERYAVMPTPEDISDIPDIKK